ncbi:MAG: hypothetical protein QM724_06025 [Flavobacteriales bacterium]
MNRLYTLAGLSLIAGSLAAQQPALLTRLHKDRSEAPRRTVAASGAREVIFSEDFANGLDGNNGVGPWTTSELNGNLWKQTFTGPHGTYSDTTEKIHSDTYLNGWIDPELGQRQLELVEPRAPDVQTGGPARELGRRPGIT